MPDEFEDADVEEVTGETVEAPSKQGLKLTQLLIYGTLGLLALIIVILISFFTANYVSGKKYREQESGIPTELKTPPYAMWEVPAGFKINTNDIEQHFVKIQMALAYKKDDVATQTELVERRFQIKHIINLILSSKSYKDLSTPEKRIDLAEEILYEINKIISERARVHDIYFIEFVVM